MKTTTTAIQQSQKHNRKQQHTDTHIYTHTCFASSCLSVVVLSPRCVGGFFLSAVSSTRSRVWRGTEWGGTSTPARGYIVSLREKTKKIYEGVDNVGGRRGVGGERSSQKNVACKEWGGQKLFAAAVAQVATTLPQYCLIMKSSVCLCGCVLHLHEPPYPLRNARFRCRVLYFMLFFSRL
jgi:hypothetical protein